MRELQYWTVTPNDRRLVAKARNGLRIIEGELKTAYYREHGYTPASIFRSIHPDDISSENFSPESNAIAFLSGFDLNLPLSFAKGYLQNPKTDIVNMTSFCKELREGIFANTDDKSISASNFQDLPGYRNYIGQGQIFYLSVMEAFVKDKGIGSLLLDYVKDKGYELIELYTSDERNRSFYERNEFLDTGIRNLTDDETRECDRYYVWHNPKFKRIRK